MTAPILTEAKSVAFFEDADNAWLDAADNHSIHYGLEQALMIEHLITDSYLGAAAETRAFVMACLAELDSAPDTPEEHAAMRTRNQASEALALKLAEQIDATRIAILTPGARMQ